MSVKWQRHYVLTVQGNDGQQYQFRDPLTLEFHIVRHMLASANTCTFRIYNLNQQTRGNIYRDKFNFTDIRTLVLQAGYSEVLPLPTIFNGNIKQAYSCREGGSPNFITEIQGYDIGFAMAKSFSSFTIAPPTTPLVTKQAVVNQLVNDMISNTPNGALKRGVIGTYSGTYPRGRTVLGPTWDVLQTETDKSCYIDNGRIYCLQNSESFEGDVRVIDSSTGLLSTPKRAETYLTIEILFEPNLLIGQQIQLESTSSPQFNGIYKVIGIEHHGIISGAVGGRCTTTVTLDLGNQIFSLLGGVLEGLLG